MTRGGKKTWKRSKFNITIDRTHATEETGKALVKGPPRARTRAFRGLREIGRGQESRPKHSKSLSDASATETNWNPHGVRGWLPILPSLFFSFFPVYLQEACQRCVPEYYVSSFSVRELNIDRYIASADPIE